MTAIAAANRRWRRFEDVPFVSGSGVRVRLNLGTPQFLHLSGRLPAEPLELCVMSRLVRPGDQFVDVGAHWGMYIPHVLGKIGPTGRYVAIEPSAQNARFLRHAFRETQPPLEVIEAAASDHEQPAYLHRDGDSQAFINAEGTDGLRVQVLRLDRFLDVDASRPVIVKIDTEGHESAVIRGCAGWAQKGIQPLFLLEFLPAIHGQTRHIVLEALRTTFGANYGLWLIDQSSGRIARFERAEELGPGVLNILAVPPALRSRLAPLELE